MNGTKEKDRKVANDKEQLQRVGEQRMTAKNSFVLTWTEYGATREIEVFSAAASKGRRPKTGS